VGQLLASRLVPRMEELRDQRQVQLVDALSLLTGLLERHLPAWQWERPRGGPSLWVRLPWGDGDTFSQVALRHGVEIVPGSAMSADGAWRDYLRIPFVFDRAQTEALVERLATAWAAYCPDERSRPEPVGVVV
jgi:DNA-binding transcriptional MocR family regulator